jgi:hypothetical protein
MSEFPGVPVDPVAPAPDDKDWTWVLDRVCAECGFDASAVRPADLADRILATTPRWQAALSASGASVRPAPQVWSATEYGAHVRDVHALFGLRARLILDQDDPEFENWDQDETALAARYWLADPEEVAQELAAAAEQTARVFATPSPEQWARTGRRSNGSFFTLATLGRYYLHDVEHHLYDVGR